MPDLTHLAWPFFDAPHGRFAPALAAWMQDEVASRIGHNDDVDRSCRSLVRALGELDGTRERTTARGRIERQ